MSIPDHLTFPTTWVIGFLGLLWLASLLVSRRNRGGRASALADGFHAGRVAYEQEIQDLHAAVCWHDPATGGLRARFPSGMGEAEIARWARQFEAPGILDRQEKALQSLLSETTGPKLPVH